MVVPYNSWHRGAGIKWRGKKRYWLEDGRAEGLSALGDGEQAAISLLPDANGTHVCIFENSQLEGFYVRDLLYFPEFWETLLGVNKIWGESCWNHQSTAQVISWTCGWHLKWGVRETILWDRTLTCEIWSYLLVESVRTELNCRAPSWCPRPAHCCGEPSLHTWWQEVSEVKGSVWVIKETPRKEGLPRWLSW